MSGTYGDDVQPLPQVASSEARQMLARYAAPELKKGQPRDISDLKRAEDEKCARINLGKRPFNLVTDHEVYQANFVNRY